MASEERLIDANALKAHFPTTGNFPDDLWLAAGIRMAIDNAPTVDAVEVVRCKDCKYYGYEPYDNGDKCCERWGEWIFPSEDDFCSCGERKDNEQT